MTTFIEQLMVGLGIDTSDYQKGLGDAEKETSKAGKSIVEKLSAVGGGVVMGALGIAAAGVGLVAAAAVKGVGAFGDWAGTLDSMGDVLGTSANESAALAVAIKSVGGNVEGITSQMTILTRGLLGAKGEIGPTGKVLEKLGVVFQRTNGEMMPAGTILQQVANKLADMPDGLEKTALMTDLFGKSGKDLTDVMNSLAGDGFDKAMAKARGFGLAIGDDAAEGAVKMGIQMEDLKMGFQGFLVQIGGALMPALSNLAGMLQRALADPTVQAGIQSLVQGITNFAGKVIEWIPQAITWFMNLVGWFREHPGLIIGILAALGVAVAAFVYTTVIPAAIATIVAMAPIILVIMAIAAVVWLLYEAWTNNWGGIRTTLTDFWNNYGKPIFDQVVAWLKVFIPQAITVLKNFWDNVLLPAIRAVWSFIQTSVFPIFKTLFDWLSKNIPVALEFLSNVWNNVLLPAIRAVWGFIQNYLWPLFKVLWELLSVSFRIALTALKGLWENVLLPALTKIWDFIKVKLQPVFDALKKFFDEKLMPVLKTLAGTYLDNVKRGFDGIKQAIQWVIEKVQAFIDKLKGIQLPPWLTPGSPTPFEMGLWGIAEAMDALNRKQLPRLQVGFEELSMGSGSRGRGDGGRSVVIYGGVTVGGMAGGRSVLEEIGAL